MKGQGRISQKNRVLIRILRIFFKIRVFGSNLSGLEEYKWKLSWQAAQDISEATSSTFCLSTVITCVSFRASPNYAQAKEEGQRFDVVIMDLTVPGGMGGKPRNYWRLTRQWRQSFQAATPTISSWPNSGNTDSTAWCPNRVPSKRWAKPCRAWLRLRKDKAGGRKKIEFQKSASATLLDAKGHRHTRFYFDGHDILVLSAHGALVHIGKTNFRWHILGCMLS